MNGHGPQRIWPFNILKESCNDEDDSILGGAGRYCMSGRLHGLRAICGRSGLQSKLPKLSRQHRNAKSRNRQDDGREGRADPDIKKLSEADEIAAVKNGKNKMKPCSGKLTDEQIKDAVDYFRTLK